MALGHHEHHSLERVGWLRAAILGANDGLISTTSLVMGVVAAGGARGEAIVAAIAGLAAGAFSMAAGEYVSVSSQSDAEKADLKREKYELVHDAEGELQELTNIYIGRGVSPETARKVAEEMTAHDALAAHARDELGITELAAAQPVLAAGASAVSFAVGAALPLIVALLATVDHMLWAQGGAAVVGLILLGAIGARLGGAKPYRAALRVLFWGVLAMVATAAIGHLVGANI